jgi:hypothetical protein
VPHTDDGDDVFCVHCVSGIDLNKSLHGESMGVLKYFAVFFNLFVLLRADLFSWPAYPRLGRFETLSPASYNQVVAQ